MCPSSWWTANIHGNGDVRGTSGSSCRRFCWEVKSVWWEFFVEWSAAIEGGVTSSVCVGDATLRDSLGIDEINKAGVRRLGD